MPRIQLLAVTNSVIRKKKTAFQTLSFLMQLENLGFNKAVNVRWAGESGGWQDLAARFVCPRGACQELWLAELTCRQAKKKPLPGTVRFSLHYQIDGEEFWDNNNGWDYLSKPGSGTWLTDGFPLANLSFPERLTEAQRSMPVSIAVRDSLQAKKVVVIWTKDSWRHIHRTPCVINKADQPNSDGNAAYQNHNNAQLWTGRLNFGNAFQVQYCIECEGEQQTLWDNNGGVNYAASRKPLVAMILNLHCYQEDNQDFKLSQIAKAISEREADIVCLQEVAENWNNGEGNWSSNAAKIINDRLPKPYHLYTDWSHLGFDIYREGVAILSRLPFRHQEARYVSDSTDVYNIHARKVVMAQVEWPYAGLLNIFSAHLSWWQDGFKNQFDRLSEWAESLRSGKVTATLLCGDFNVEAGSEGYRLVVDSHQYEDQFLAASSPVVFEKIFKVVDPHWRDYLAEDYRIDYIFMNKTANLKAVSSEVLFTGKDYGRVSDHCGYMVTFEPLDR